MFAARYMVKKAPIMRKIETLPESRRKRIEPLWVALSSLEFQLTQLAIVFLWGPVGLMTILLLGVVTGVIQTISPLPPSTSLDLVFLSGMAAAVLSGIAAVIGFWIIRAHPERKRIAAEIKRMIALDPQLPDMVAEVDTDLVARSRKFLV